ncbi:MAG TPA: hypothetical protein VF283_00275 [Bryobacteraceae bacterium]
MKSAFLVLLLALPLWAASATITYTRNFPGSQPPYFSVSVDRSGALQYKESPKDNHPVRAQLPKADTDAIFSMARKLGYFKKPLESHLKVANTGKKTFRYQNGAASSETIFNYSTNPVAQQLQARFENIADTERAYIALNRDVHYYKLGVNDSLAQVEALWLNHQLAAPLQFVPLLDRIASHQEFMHIMRERAGRLKSEFTAAAHVASAGPKPRHKR